MVLIPILFGIGTAATVGGTTADILFKQRADDLNSKMANLQADAVQVQVEQAKAYNDNLEKVITQQMSMLKQIGANIEYNQKILEVDAIYNRKKNDILLNTGLGVNNAVAIGCSTIVSLCIVGSAIYVVKHTSRSEKAKDTQ